jgi:hypothetical protein
MTKRKPNPLPIGRPRLGNERHTVSLPPALWAHVDAQEGDTRSARLAVVVGRDMEAGDQIQPGAILEYANYFCTAWHLHRAGDVAPMTFDEWCADAQMEVSE